MDETAKAKLRNRARILHWVTELILFVFLLFTLVAAGSWPSLKKALSEIFLNDELFDAHRLVMAESGRFYSERATDLFAYPPPEKSNERATWAHKIAQDFRQPVAVFVKDHDGVEWFTCPPELAPGRKQVERFFILWGDRRTNVLHHRVGTMDMFQVSFDSDTLGFKADFVGSLTLRDTLLWGIVRRYADTWRAFLISLNDPQTVVGPGHPAYLLQRVVSLPSDPTPPLPQYRASIGGEVIFSSPMLDTTRHKYVYDVGHVRQEFFNTKSREMQARLISRHFISWIDFLLPLFLMLVVHIYWLWIKELTAPCG